MSSAFIPGSVDGDSLHDSATTFRFKMVFLVEAYSTRSEYQEPCNRVQKVEAFFGLVVPDDRSLAPWLDYQIKESLNDYNAVYSATPIIPGNDEFCPRSRRLPAEGIDPILQWLDEVNIWEWQPPVTARQPTGVWQPQTPELYPPLAPFVDLDVRYRHEDADWENFENVWSLEVARGGRYARKEFVVYGAPAPSAYAFEEAAWAPRPTRLVPILANHLAFLANDPIIVGLTKRLLRLLPREKPRQQIAQFNNGAGTEYVLDFERMVARKTIRNHSFGLGALGVVNPKTVEVAFSEYDRMRLWGVLLDFKSTDSGLMPTSSLEGIADADPAPQQPGRKWSGELCDGKNRWRFETGRTTIDDEALRLRFAEAFEAFFSFGAANCASDLLPRITLPASNHVSGWRECPNDLPALAPIYANTIEERIRYSKCGSFWSGALLGDVECMLNLAREPLGYLYWYEEAIRLGSPLAMVEFAHRSLGIVPSSGAYLKDEKKIVDASGRALVLYQAAYVAGYMPAALGLGFLYEHGIGVSADLKLAVSYYLQSLGDSADVPDTEHSFAYARLERLYGTIASPLYDIVKSKRFWRMLDAAQRLHDVKKAEIELKRSQVTLDIRLHSYQDALKALVSPPRVTRIYNWGSEEECEVVRFVDFSDFIPSTKSIGEGLGHSVYVPRFLAELVYKANKQHKAFVYCINHSGPSGVTQDTVFLSCLSRMNHGARFLIPKECAHLAASEAMEIGPVIDGVCTSKHRLSYGGYEISPDSPEWGHHWADYRRFMRLVSDQLGDVSDPNHLARKRFTDHVKETGAEMDPFIKDMLGDVGSVLSAELPRRYNICLVLARTMRRNEELSELAISEVAQATGMSKPSLERYPDGSLLRPWSVEVVVDKYIQKMCPWFGDFRSFIEEYDK